MKGHPAVFVEKRIEDSAAQKEQVEALVKSVQDDHEQMRSFLDRQAFYRWTRYGAGDPGRRGVGGPWVGASDIYMPLPEVYCNQVVAPYMNLLHGGTRHVQMVPASAEAWKNRPQAELVMEAWARGGGKHQQPDLRRQTAYMISNLTQTGRGVLHSSYRYTTRIEATTLSRERLPGILGKLVIVPAATAQQRLTMMQAFPQINGPEILAFFGTDQPIQPLDKELFKQFAPKIEAAVVRLFNLDEDDTTDKVAIADIMAYFKAGTPEKKFVVRMRAIIEDGPRLTSIEPQDLIVPEGTLTDFSRAERITERMHMTRSEAAAMAKDAEWRNMDEAMESADAISVISDALVEERAVRTLQKTTLPLAERDDLVELWKIWSYEPLVPAVSETAKDEVWQRPELRQLVCTIVEPNSKAVLYRANVEGDIPYTCFTLEANSSDYFDSRGVAEMLRDVTAHVNSLYRGLENIITLTTWPTFQAKRGAYTDPEGFEISPGDVVLVDNPGDIQQFPMSANTFPMERLLASLMQWPERIIGGIDHQLGGGDEPRERPRTAREMGMIDAARQRILGVRALVFLDDYASALQKIWNLMVRYGPDEMFIAVSGQPPVRLSQAQIRGDFLVRPVAAVGDMDPSNRIQKALSRFQMMMEARPVLDADISRAPQYMQALVDVFDADDPMATQSLLPPRPDQEIQRILKMKQDEEQRQMQLEQMAAQLDANVAADPEALIALMKELKKYSPMGEFQRWRQASAQIKAQAQQARDQIGPQNGRMR